MQIKTTMRHHFTLISMAKSLEITCAREDVEKKEPSTILLLEMYIGAATMENDMEIP